MQMPARDRINLPHFSFLRSLAGIRAFFGIIALGLLSVIPSRAADDIVIDGTTTPSPAAFGNATATSTVRFDGDVTVSATTGSFLNLAGVTNQVNVTLTNTANSTLTFGSTGNNGTIVLGGNALNEPGNPYSIVIAHGEVEASGNTNIFKFANQTTVNGDFDLNGNAVTLNGLSGSGSIFSNAAGAQLIIANGTGVNTTFSGLIEPNLSLVKNGNGTLTLTNQSNSYAGGTTINSGTLQVTDLKDLGLGTITLNLGTLNTSPVGSTTQAVGDLHVTGVNATLEAADGTSAFYQNLSGDSTTQLNIGDAAFHASEIGFTGDSSGFSGQVIVAGGMSVGLGTTGALGTGDITLLAGSSPVTFDNVSNDVVTLANDIDLSNNDLRLNAGNFASQTVFTGMLNDHGDNHGLIVAKGTVTLQANNDYTGGTTVQDGELLFSRDQNLGSQSPVVHLDGGSLIYNPVGPGTTLTSHAVIDSLSEGGLGSTTGNTVIYDQALTGAGFVFGSPLPVGIFNGEVALTGNNTFSSGVIQYGFLGVGNDHALGNGDFGMEGGTLQTFGTQRTINVAGSFDQEVGTLLLNASGSAATDHDELVVSGTAHINHGGGNGGTSLVVNLLNGYRPTLADPLVALEAASLTGTFDQVTITGGSAKVEYTNDEVLIYGLAFGGIPGLTPNQQAVATNLDQFNAAPNSNAAALIDALSPLTNDPVTLGAALEQLSPQPLQVFGHIAFDNASFSSSQLNNHLANLRDGLTGFDGSQLTVNDSSLSAPLSQIKGRLLAWDPSSTPGLVSDVVNPIISGMDLRAEDSQRDPWSTFISGNVVLADLSHNQDLNHQDYTTGTVSLGADYRIDRHFTIGSMLSYAHTDTNLDHNGSSATVDSYSPAIYASYVDGGWYGNGLFAYDYNSYTEDRNVDIGGPIPGIRGGGLNGTNHGASQGNQFTGNLTGGYEFQRGGWKFGPVASAQYSNLGINAFDEQGPTALNIANQNAESFRTQLGVEARYALRAGSVYLTPHASLSWQHEFLDDSRGITSSFNGSGAGSFTVATSSPDRDSAFIDVGLNADVTHALTLFADYTTQAGQSDFFAQSVQAGVKVSF